MNDSYTIIDNNYFKDNYEKYKEKKVLDVSDNRPNIGNFSLVKKNIIKKENIELNAKTETSRKNNIKKYKDELSDQTITDIFKNISKTVNNFSSDYDKKFDNIKNNYNIIKYENSKDISYTFVDKINIHLIAMVNYMTDGTNISYIGMLLILISFLIYIINIIR
tara:strand:+ start:227 stop:718 length:492 start_codon:yes stop_codon:yes gene_type:complete